MTFGSMVTSELNQRRRALAQVGDASTETTLYTCPEGRIAVGRVLICEVGGAAATVRVRIKTDTDGNGTIDADVNAQFVVHDAAIAANDYNYTVEIWLSASEITGGAADLIEVFASTANVSFTFNGYTLPMSPL